MKGEIEIQSTQLGMARSQMANATAANIGLLSEKDREALEHALQDHAVQQAAAQRQQQHAVQETTATAAMAGTMAVIVVAECEAAAESD